MPVIATVVGVVATAAPIVQGALALGAAGVVSGVISENAAINSAEATSRESDKQRS